MTGDSAKENCDILELFVACGFLMP